MGYRDYYPEGECVACSGKLVEIVEWAAWCEECGGIHATEAAIPCMVNTHAPMFQGESNDMLYFDITTWNRRIHGWVDMPTRRVVQYG